MQAMAHAVQSEHPPWFTVKFCPATVTVPLLPEAGQLRGATLKVAAPLPVPLPEAMVIHPAWLVDVQEQPLLVVTRVPAAD